MTDGVRVVGSAGEADAPTSAPAADGSLDRMEATAGPGETQTPGGRSRPRSVVVLAVLAAVGLLGTVGFGIAWRRAGTAVARQGSAQATAKDFLLALTNFDAGTVDADFARIQSYATGDFAAQANDFFGSRVRQALKEVQASSRGEVRSTYVETLSGSRATVFGVVDQTIINSKFSSPEADELRIELTLVRADGRWRVSGVNVLQAPPVASPLPTTTTVPAAKPGP